MREQLQTIERERAPLAAVGDALDGELAGVPGDEAVRDCHALLMARDEERRLMQERIAHARERREKVTTRASDAERAATQGAQELGLVADPRQLTAVERGLGDLRTALAGLWPAVDERGRAQAAAERATHEAGNAEREAEAQLASSHSCDVKPPTAPSVIAPSPSRLARPSRSSRSACPTSPGS